MKLNNVEQAILKELGIKSESGTNNEVLKKEFQNKKDRRKIRETMIELLLIISKCKTQKQFDVFYSRFAESYKRFYISQEPTDFSVFNNIRNESKISIIESAEKVIAKFVKK